MRLCQKTYLAAMLDYMDHGGKSRGSAVYRVEGQTGGGQIRIPGLTAFSLDGPDGRAHDHEVQEILYDREEKNCHIFWRKVRKLEDIPEPQAFESVWKAYREKQMYHV